jgi:tRNA(Arg) A34 adenosine deaminase TadA
LWRLPKSRHILLKLASLLESTRLFLRYDMYVTKEPNIYEAMALVHSRVRRVVFGVRDEGMGGLGGAVDAANSRNAGIHSLPGTNHHYRAFHLDVAKCDNSDEEITALILPLIKVHSYL